MIYKNGNVIETIQDNVMSYICLIDKLLLIRLFENVYGCKRNGTICHCFVVEEDLVNCIRFPVSGMRNELSFVWLRLKWPLLNVKRTHCVVKCCGKVHVQFTVFTWSKSYRDTYTRKKNTRGERATDKSRILNVVLLKFLRAQCSCSIKCGKIRCPA